MSGGLLWIGCSSLGSCGGSGSSSSHPHYRHHHQCRRLPPRDGRWNHPHRHHRGRRVDCGFDLQEEAHYCHVPDGPFCVPDQLPRWA